MLLTFFLACQPSAKDPTDAGTGGEAADPLRAEDIVATVSPAIATVIRVSWTTQVPTLGQVRYGRDETEVLHTPMETVPSTTHTALLLGIPAAADVHFRVWTTDGTAEAQSDDAVTRTEDLPTALPSLLRTGEPDPVGGYLSLVLLGGTNAATFIDTDGNIVWYHLEDRGYLVQRARLSVDGQSVLYDAVWIHDEADYGEIVRVSLDGTVVQSYPVPRHSHDFVELPDGTICAVYYDIREFDTGTVFGDAILELAPDGSTRTVWSAFDTYDPVTDTSPFTIDRSWTHVNAMHYDVDDDALYVNFRNFSSLLKIDRQSGEVLWTLGGYHDDYTWAEGTERPDGQHGFEFVTPGELLLFNNGPEDARASHAMAYEIDQEARTIREVWSYHHDPELYVYALGDVERRQDGGTRVTWSTAGTIDQLDNEGQLEWSLSIGFGIIFGYSGWYPALQ